MAHQLKKTVFLLLVLCSLTLASPVFFAEEAADGNNVPAASAVNSAVLKEDADKDKLGEKALVDDEATASMPGAIVKSEEDADDTTSEEITTEPVKKLLIRTFTDLHPKVALELINKTMSIVNETDSVVEDAVLTTTESVAEDEEQTTTTEAIQESSTPGIKTDVKPEVTSTTSTTVESASSSTSTTSTSSTDANTTESTTPDKESSTATATTSSTTTEKTSSTTAMSKEKKIEEIEDEIEADPVILTQGV